MMLPKMLIAHSSRHCSTGQRPWLGEAPPDRQERTARQARSGRTRRASMNSKILVLMAGTALAVAACAKHENANTSGADTGNASDLNMTTDNGAMGNSGATATTTAPAPTTAQGFVNAAAASDKFEIESSKLAATAASSAAVKRFATQMISAHTAST